MRTPLYQMPTVSLLKVATPNRQLAWHIFNTVLNITELGAEFQRETGS